VVKISVVVPVANDERLSRCLEALEHQTIDARQYEVLVADNAASDRTRRMVGLGPARYLAAPGPGAYAARNHGIREAKGEILAFTDSDCVPSSGWLEVIHSVFERGGLDVAVGPSYAVDTAPVGLLIQAVDDRRWARLAREQRVMYADTRNLAGPRDLFVREPFDEAFRHGGDLEWGIRMSRLGTRIHFVPEMALGHANVSTLREAWRRGVRRGRGVARLAQKHGDAANISGARPLALFGLDVKAPVLRTLTHPTMRPLSRPVFTTVTAVAMAAVWTCLATAGLRRWSLPCFTFFDRTSLLLGRIIGP
jgi:glycosyltransferase involved in cell wall biosynthesis